MIPGPFDNPFGGLLGQVASQLVPHQADPTSTDSPKPATGVDSLQALSREWRERAREKRKEDDNYADGYASGLCRAADDLAERLGGHRA